MTISGQRLTLEEFLELPEEKPALEFVDGEITAKMSPNMRHSRLEVWLAMRIELAGSGLDPLLSFTEARVIFGGRSYVPDAVVYRTSRAPVDADGEFVEYSRVPPDVAVEVTSPGQSIEDQDDRCRWYVANGVTVALRVHPRTRVVRVFRASGESDDLHGDDVIDLEDVATGLRFTVNELFGALRPRPAARSAESGGLARE